MVSWLVRRRGERGGSGWKWGETYAGGWRGHLLCGLEGWRWWWWFRCWDARGDGRAKEKMVILQEYPVRLEVQVVCGLSLFSTAVMFVLSRLLRRGRISALQLQFIPYPRQLEIPGQAARLSGLRYPTPLTQGCGCVGGVTRRCSVAQLNALHNLLHTTQTCRPCDFLASIYAARVRLCVNEHDQRLYASPR